MTAAGDPSRELDLAEAIDAFATPEDRAEAQRARPAHEQRKCAYDRMLFESDAGKEIAAKRIPWPRPDRIYSLPHPAVAPDDEGVAEWRKHHPVLDYYDWFHSRLRIPEESEDKLGAFRGYRESRKIFDERYELGKRWARESDAIVAIYARGLLDALRAGAATASGQRGGVDAARTEIPAADWRWNWRLRPAEGLILQEAPPHMAIFNIRILRAAQAAANKAPTRGGKNVDKHLDIEQALQELVQKGFSLSANSEILKKEAERILAPKGIPSIGKGILDEVLAKMRREAKAGAAPPANPQPPAKRPGAGAPNRRRRGEN